MPTELLMVVTRDHRWPAIRKSVGVQCTEKYGRALAGKIRFSTIINKIKY